MSTELEQSLSAIASAFFIMYFLGLVSSRKEMSTLYGAIKYLLGTASPMGNLAYAIDRNRADALAMLFERLDYYIKGGK